MMRILFVCPDSPFPPRDGGSLRIINLARSLASHSSVMLLSYVNSPEENMALAQLEQGPGLHVRGVQRPARRNVLTRAWHKLVYYYRPYLFTSLPGPAGFNLQPVMRDALLAVVKDYMPDVIIWEYWFMSGFAELARAVRPEATQVLDTLDLEWIRIQRAMTTSRGLAHFWQRYSEPRIRRYALERFSCMDCVTFLSQADADLARRDLPNPARLEVVPMGLMLAEYSAPITPPEPERVLFFGSFRHQPNADALRFLLQDVWPRIQQACPQATLDLMGSSLPRWVQRAVRQVSGVRLLGFQPDIRPTLAEAAVVIAPLRFGSGVKIKILEAMALGKAVVTTPIGAEGIEAQPDRDLVIADGAQALAAATIRLLTDPSLRNSVGQHARQFIQTHHAADEISKGFLARLAECGVNHEQGL